MTLASLREGLSKAIAKIRRAPYVDERLVKEVVRDIQRALLKADVDVRLVLSLSKTLERRLREEQPPPGFTRRDLALKVVYEELLKLLGGERRFELAITKRPYVVMLVGIQGSGKTTSAAKLAYYLKRKGYRVGLVCADNFRPGAAEQLRQLGEKVGVPVCAPLDAPSAVLGADGDGSPVRVDAELGVAEPLGILVFAERLPRRLVRAFRHVGAAVRRFGHGVRHDQ